jgi:hypothetical protein
MENTRLLYGHACRMYVYNIYNIQIHLCIYICIDIYNINIHIYIYIYKCFEYDNYIPVACVHHLRCDSALFKV